MHGVDILLFIIRIFQLTIFKQYHKYIVVALSYSIHEGTIAEPSFLNSDCTLYTYNIKCAAHWKTLYNVFVVPTTIVPIIDNNY